MCHGRLGRANVDRRPLPRTIDVNTAETAVARSHRIDGARKSSLFMVAFAPRPGDIN
jgi:hypothetical protein